MQKILIITGWAVGTQPLQALKDALTQKGFDVELVNIFNGFDTHDFIKHVKLAEQFDVIMGWSLGGQLATKLVQHIYEQTGQLKALITLASNPCFISNETWEIGMENSTFLSFKDSFEKDPLTTLKRFCYLVTQGRSNAKQDWQKLQSSVNDEELALKSSGLDMLERFNTVDIIQHYPGNQFHVFAEGDGLVSYKIVDNFRKLGAKFLKIDSINGSHGFPVFQGDSLSDKITQYLKRL